MDGLHLEIKPDKYHYFAGDIVIFSIKFSNIQSSTPVYTHNRSISAIPSTSSSISAPTTSTLTSTSQNTVPKDIPQRCGLIGKQPENQNQSSIGKGRPSPLRHNRNVHSIDYSSPSPSKQLSKRFSSDTLNSSANTDSQQSPQSPSRSPSLPNKHPHTRKASTSSTPMPSSSTMQDSHSQKLSRNLKTPLLPNHEKILWATAQLNGKVELNNSLIKKKTTQSHKSSQILGGGIIDSKENKKTHHRRSSTLFNFNLSNWFHQANQSNTLSKDKDIANKNTSLSLWETRRAVLIVDKVLAPNEEFVIKFQHQLPSTLPPTYDGKIGKISYQFVLGTNKQNGSARIVNMPLTVLPNVTLDEDHRRFDILKPLIETKEESKVDIGDVKDSSDKTSQDQALCFEKAYRYANKLHSSVNKSTIKRSSSTHSSGYDGPFEHVDSNAKVGEQCRTAIGINSRHSQKVTYEIAKEGLNIGVLSLVKSTFRLGETVLGKISINKPHTVSGRVLKFSATLESHEVANDEHAALNTKHTINATRKVHSEFHEPLTIDFSELGFALDVPSHQSSDFQTSIFEVRWVIKLSFLTLSPPIMVEPSPRPSISPGSSTSLNDWSPLPTPTLQPLPRTPFTSSSMASFSTPSSPSLNVSLGNGTYVKAISHLVGVDGVPNSYRPQDRLGGGDGKGKEEVIQCQIPIKILPNSTDYEPDSCTLVI
ncbi:Rgp1-domain-containing protein [Wallemia mellicola]|nr:Rgp1-domain-containing protein [Wallemia mellicola]